jgi:signal transduction histidine kinase/DNA-binding response OmpR family regulator
LPDFLDVWSNVLIRLSKNLHIMKDAYWKYIVIVSLMIALCIIAFLQINAKRSIDKLINGNEQALNEFKNETQLQKLCSNILAVESQIRGMVITKDSTHIQDIEKEIASVKTDLDNVEKSLFSTELNKQTQQLRYLVNEKIHFSQLILDEFYTHGKEAAEKTINTNRGKRLTDSILKLADEIEKKRQTQIRELFQTNDSDSTNAVKSNIWLATISGIALLMASLFVVLRLMSQAKLIKELDESHKRELQATEIKEQFMANMSHEIRTPMNAIIGFTNILQKGKLNKIQTQYVNAIQTSGENLLTIVNDILDFSKIEAGMMRIESVPFSLRGILQDIETIFIEKIRLRDLALGVEISTDLPDVLLGDAVRLTQILVNLISNAIKFTEKGNILVRIYPSEKTENLINNSKNIELLFEVIDTGIGIPKDKLGVIFDRFRQASSDITRRFGGSGLGLSIVKSLIDLQGGNIDVKSVLNQGTTFSFTIPYKISDEQFETHFKDKTSQKEFLLAQNAAYTEGVKVLIVEDNQLNQDLMQQLLTSWNLHFKIARDGFQALEYLRKESFNLILMDIQMPEMDGYTATQKIRNELNIQIPIIALTAHVLAGERERCLSAGMNEYLPKPIREQNLRALIAQFVKVDDTRITDNISPQNSYSKNGENEHKILNVKYLQDLSKGNESFVKAMLVQFVEQMPQELTDLEKAISVKNFPLVKTIAHNMKTTVAFVGLDEILHPLLDSIENATLKQDTFEILQAFKKIKNLCEQAIKEINLDVNYWL